MATDKRASRGIIVLWVGLAMIAAELKRLQERIATEEGFGPPGG